MFNRVSVSRGNTSYFLCHLPTSCATKASLDISQVEVVTSGDRAWGLALYCMSFLPHYQLPLPFTALSPLPPHGCISSSIPNNPGIMCRTGQGVVAMLCRWGISKEKEVSVPSNCCYHEHGIIVVMVGTALRKQWYLPTTTTDSASALSVVSKNFNASCFLGKFSFPIGKYLRFCPCMCQNHYNLVPLFHNTVFFSNVD